MSQRGFALILVIWGLLLLTSIASGFMAAVRSETASSTYLTDEVQAEAALYAGFQFAINQMLDSPRSKSWSPDASLRTLAWGDRALEIRLRDVNSRINPNIAPEEILHGLFTEVLSDVDSERLAAAVIQHRNAHSKASKNQQLHGSKHGSGLPAIAFESPATLSEVEGMRSDYVAQLAQFLTVHSVSAKISAQSASAEVLASVPGISREAAIEHVKLRAMRKSDSHEFIHKEIPRNAEFLSPEGPKELIYVEAGVKLAADHFLTESTLIQLDYDLGTYRILSREYLPPSP